MIFQWNVSATFGFVVTNDLISLA